MPDHFTVRFLDGFVHHFVLERIHWGIFWRVQFRGPLVNVGDFVSPIFWGFAMCGFCQIRKHLAFWVLVATSTTALYFMYYHSEDQEQRISEATLAPVWPHVLDRWCAGLVALVVDLFGLCLLASVSNFVHLMRRCVSTLSQVHFVGFFVGCQKPHRHVGVGHLSRWWAILVSLMLLHRGEALHPGPSSFGSQPTKGLRTWSMGTFNPSGLGGKQQVVSSYLNHGDLWAIAETHLTSQGIRSFRQGLKWSDSEFTYCIGGKPVPLRSHSCATGSWNGVAVISKYPTRAVPVPWGDQVFETSRVQLTATLCENMWITGAVLYGEPPGVGHPNARSNTDLIALDAITHLSQLSGLRYFAGDLNFEIGGLEAFQVLEEAGFKDIQDIAFEQWGRPISKTCKQVTRKDFFFVSRELIPFLTGVTVDETVWADHAVLQGFFSCGPESVTKHVWRQPAPVDWPEHFRVEFSDQFHQEGDSNKKYSLLWHEVESAASCAFVQKGQKPLTKKQCGRGATLDTQVVKSSFHQSPVRQGRASDIQPLFAGNTLQHAHWFRQLRRLQSYVRFRKVHSNDTLTGHGVTLWSSILRAKGFEGSFVHWWKKSSSKVFGAPECIPLIPPLWEQASRIYESFLISVRSLEQSLKSKQCKFARDKRKELAHMIFRDIRRTAPDRVDVLLQATKAEITEIDPASNTIKVNPDCCISCDHPIFVDGVEFNPVHVQGNKIWITDISGLCQGQVVRQTTYTGCASDLSHAFGEEWSKRWDRHKDVPISQWDQICSFGRQYFQHQPFELPAWTPNMLSQEIARKKPRSATGLDGVSLSDLKAMPFEVIEAHCQIFHTAETHGVWPKQALVGKVASLAKSEAPSSINGFRPITILPHCYRLWSGVRSKALLSFMSSRCPSFLFGNKPHCQASMVWTHLAWAVEEAFSCEVALGGIVADIEKAFNHLPREVVFQTAVACGLPFETLRAWASAMGGLERRFQIRENLGPPVRSSTGFPEGCALSCLAMLLMDCLFHKWFEVQFPLCQPISYVDDLQILTRNPQQIPEMLQELHFFSSLVDLTVDNKKTFVWSTSAYLRSTFRKKALPIRKHARGLGAQLQFGRLHSTEIIRGRLEEVKPLWPRLGQSLSPYRVKVLAIKQAAWSRCLHGIAATSISQEIFVSLRTQAMRGLNASGAGCNPCVHLGMIEHPLLDPYCWAIADTFRTVRECASRESLAVLMREAVSGSSRLPQHGMTSILVSRVHHLGWEVTSGVNCHDGLGEFSLLDVSFPELLLRVSWAWQKYVASTVSHRASFAGLADCDPISTREYVDSLPVAEQGLMRKSLNGALFTNDSVCYFSSTGSSVCQFCGEEDSRLHRYWHCKVFTEERVVRLPGFWEAFESLPFSLLCHGWAIRSSTWVEWQKCLQGIVLPDVRVTCQPLGEQWIDIFTDGSCLWPRDRSMRVASWSLVEASPGGNVCHSQVVWAGPLSGVLQSAYRAELQAVCCAVRYALHWKRKVRIWSDCLSVVQRFSQLVFYNRVLKPNGPHFDIWADLLDLVEQLGAESIRITKVAAHQDVSVVPSALENWAFQHNIVADRAARLANLQRDAAFWELHRRHCLETERARSISLTVQSVILAISLKVVAREVVLSKDETIEPAVAGHVEPVMIADAPPWNGVTPSAPFPLELTRRFGHRFVATLVAWFEEAVKSFESGCQTAWISVHQLYIDFQHQTGELGLVYDKVWKDPEILPGLKLVPRTFRRRSAWFGKAIRSIFRAYGVEIPWMVTRPHSMMIALHTSSLALPWPEWRRMAVEKWLMQHLPTKKAATRDGHDLVHLPPAKQDGSWPQLTFSAGPLGS